MATTWSPEADVAALITKRVSLAEVRRQCYSEVPRCAPWFRWSKRRDEHILEQLLRPSGAQRALDVVSTVIVTPSLLRSEQMMNDACGADAGGAVHRGTYASSR